jgi:hypothetical protein
MKGGDRSAQVRFLREDRAMATLVTPTKLQKLEFPVPPIEGAEGPGRVTIITGMVQIWLVAYSSGPEVNEKESFKLLLDPLLTPGQFRKATSITSLSNMVYEAGATPNQTEWAIDDAQATFDDEAGQVQLVVDVRVRASGNATSAYTSWLMFQVTTLARV